MNGVSAVVLNVTATQPSASSYVTVWPKGETRPLASNLNMAANQTIPNLVVAKVGAGGQVSLYNNNGSTHLVADVAGWLQEGTGASTTMTLTAGTVLEGPGDVVSLDGDSNQDSIVTLSGSADLPAVGGHVAVYPTTAAPEGFLR